MLSFRGVYVFGLSLFNGLRAFGVKNSAPFFSSPGSCVQAPRAPHSPALPSVAGHVFCHLNCISSYSALHKNCFAYSTRARACFRWTCRRLQRPMPHWHAWLISVKNSAYAWRQMIFYLSLRSPDQIGGFLVWCEEYLRGQPVPFQTRFAPALRGLAAACHHQGVETDESRRFLGWSQTRHWLSGDAGPA